MEEESKISVEEMQELIKNLEQYYINLGSPKQNAFWIADLVIKRLKEDYDLYINVTGERGKGKSNLTLLLTLLQVRYAGIWRNSETGKVVRVKPRTRPLPKPWVQQSVDFDFNKNISFLDEMKEVKSKFNSLGQYCPFVIDEGSKNLHKQNWMQKTQFMLVQLSDTERYQNKSFYICFPNFRELNSIFRNDRIRMILHVYDRGKAIISMKDPNRYTIDPWHLDENDKTIQYELRHVPIVARGPYQLLRAEKRTKNYAGCFEFPALKEICPRIWDVYMKYKIDNAKKELKEKEEAPGVSKQTAKWKNATKELMKWLKEKYPTLTFKELSNISNVGTATIKEMWDEDIAARTSEPVELVRAPRNIDTLPPIENTMVPPDET